jgi:hypothetical protein
MSLYELILLCCMCFTMQKVALTMLISLNSGWDLYSASDALPHALLDPEIGSSYSVKETAWQKAIGTTKERWNWLEEGTTATELHNGGSGAYPGPFGPDVTAILQGENTGESIRRPELDIFGLAMLGGGRVFGVAHLFGMPQYTVSGTEPKHILTVRADFPWASLGKAQVVDVGGGVGMPSHSPSPKCY